MNGPLTVADVLDRAADLIEPEGAWTQHWFGVGPDAVCSCIVGAIGRARGNPVTTWNEEWVDENTRFLGMEAHALEMWNDAPGRTQAEVVAKLREAAALAREQGA